MSEIKGLSDGTKQAILGFLLKWGPESREAQREFLLELRDVIDWAAQDYPRTTWDEMARPVMEAYFKAQEGEYAQ